MSILVNIVGIFLVIYILLLSITKPLRAVPFAVLSLIGSFGISGIDYNFVAKLLVVITSLICITKLGIKKKKLFLIYPILILFLLGLYNVIEKGSYVYTLKDFITSFATIGLGILLFYINWNESSRLSALKLIAWSGCFAICLGIFDKGAIFIGNRLVSIGMFSQLPFWCGSGLYAAILLVKYYKLTTYRYLIYLNFIFIFLTQSRGGAIFGVILIFPFIIEKIKTKKVKISTLIKILATLPIILIMMLGALSKLLERTFVNGEINSTNRFEAWIRLIELSSNNRVIGMGIGSLKTITGEYIINQGFHAAHNEYIRFIYETGIIGTVLIGITILFIFKYLLRNYIISDKKYAVALIISFIVYSLTDNTISAGEFWAPYMLVVSLSLNPLKNVSV